MFPGCLYRNGVDPFLPTSLPTLFRCLSPYYTRPMLDILAALSLGQIPSVPRDRFYAEMDPARPGLGLRDLSVGATRT